MIKDRYNNGIKEVSDAYGELLVKTLKKNLKRLGKEASGSLIKSITHEVKQEKGKSVINLIGNTYLTNVDKGRKPGKLPPLSAISRWASIKGISQRAVFPIAKKIAEKGVPKTDVIKISIREVQKSFLPLLKETMGDLVADSLIKEIFGKDVNFKAKRLS